MRRRPSPGLLVCLRSSITCAMGSLGDGVVAVEPLAAVTVAGCAGPEHMLGRGAWMREGGLQGPGEDGKAAAGGGGFQRALLTCKHGKFVGRVLTTAMLSTCCEHLAAVQLHPCKARLRDLPTHGTYTCVFLRRASTGPRLVARSGQARHVAPQHPNPTCVDGR